MRDTNVSANAMEPTTHEFCELLGMIDQIKKRLDALESAPEDTKRRPQSLEEMELYFAKAGLTRDDAKWLWSKMIVSGWRNDGKVVRSWQHLVIAWKIANVFPSQKAHKANGHSIFELKTVLEAKKEEAKDLVNKSYNDSGAFHKWRNEAHRQRYIVLKREIINLQSRIGQSV
jgi:hypothetical protein